MIKIFNTLTKQKEELRTIDFKTIKLYVCGVTVYDLCHLGHGRTFVVFDAIIRYLRHSGYRVIYARNITDIDDKIIQRACKNNETVTQLTNRMIKEMYKDLDSLSILRPNYEPKVTEYMDIIIKFIYMLIKKNHAYLTKNRDVMFSTKTAHNYGILSHRKIMKNCNSNNHILNHIKKNSEDFVLWKSYKLGEPYWVAPWGKGRPGWHIECSAINYAIFGKNVDIHGGGSDLIFPHHDNEIAQSTCAYNTSYVNIWMHSGLLLLNNEKMSKSSNNLFTIREVLKKYDAETIRYFLLSAHYRNKLQYNDSNLKSAQSSLRHLYISLRDINSSAETIGGKHFIKKFISKMNDDFNTPAAYAVLFEIAHELNFLKKNNHPLALSIAATLKYLANILGFLYQNPENYLKNISLHNDKSNLNVNKINELIQQREYARKNNKWNLADDIRRKLTMMNVILEDESTGKTKWRVNF